MKNDGIDYGGDVMSYSRFAAMVITSTIVMFGLMYLNTYALEHVFWSQTRAWMAVVMGATMAIIMLAFMLGMYKRQAVNVTILIGSAAIFGIALWLVRSQATVGEDSYMEAMIPHHSIAILTSERAQISDPRVRKLADGIIEAQEREIAEMRYLIGRAAASDQIELGGEPEVAPIATAADALDGADIPALDPTTMSEVEISSVLGRGPRCIFQYTRAGGPVLAFVHLSDGTYGMGVVKLNGNLIPLMTPEGGGNLVLGADPVRLSFETGLDLLDGSAVDQREAELVFEVDDMLKVGYGGHFSCQR